MGRFKQFYSKHQSIQIIWWVVVGFLVGALISAGIITGTEKLGWIGTLTLVGSIAGVISLFWHIRDRFLYKPIIKLTTKLVYKDDVPIEIEIIADNQGKEIEFIEWGFVSSDYYDICSWHPGLLPHKAIKGKPFKFKYDIETIVQGMKKFKIDAKYYYVQDINKKYYVDEVPKQITDILQKMISNSVKT